LSNLFSSSRTTQSGLFGGMSPVASSQISRIGQSVRSGSSFKNQALSTTAIFLTRTNEGRQLVSGATSALVSGVTSIAKSIGSGLGDLFSTKKDVPQADLKNLTTDSVMTNLTTGGGQATSGYFKTSVTSATMSNVPVGGGGENSTLALTSGGNLAVVAASAQRMGVNVPTTDTQYSALKTVTAGGQKNAQVSGIFNSGVLSALTTSVVSNTTIDSNTLTAANLARGQITMLAPSGSSYPDRAMQYYNPSLPAFALPNGGGVPGYSQSTTPDMAEVFGRGVNQYGLPSNTLGGGVNYAAQQNSFDSLFAVAAEEGAVAYLQGMSQSPMYGSSTQSIAQRVLPKVVGSPTTTNILVDLVGPQNVRGSQSILMGMSRNQGTLGATEVAGIASIATKLGSSPSYPYDSGVRAAGGDIVWDRKGAQATNQRYTATYAPTPVKQTAFAATYTGTSSVSDPFISGGF
jgi:hypothetical protein